MQRERLSGQALLGADVQVRGCRVVLTEELLDWRGEQFLFYSVREMLGITFERFLTDPHYYLNRVCMLVKVVVRERSAFERETAHRMERNPLLFARTPIGRSASSGGSHA
jgi:hypothetical protein